MATIQNNPITLTPTHLVKIFGLSTTDAQTWWASMWPAMQKYQITNLLRASMFFGNLSVESNNLKTLKENLNYSAAGLMKTFPSRFPSIDIANQYAHNPQKIANRAYANKLGNQDESSGDGWTYAGKGAIQLTGKENYTNCSRNEINCIGSNASVLSTPDGAARSACWFWGSRGINRYADTGDFSSAVRRVNAALLDLDKRTKAYQLAVAVLSGDPNAQIQPSNTGSVTHQPTPDAANASVEEPKHQAYPEYPNNKVYQSPGGHLIEIDDTPGAERLHAYHMSGSYIEFLPNGDVVIKAMKDLYFMVGGDLKVGVKGNQTAVIGGQSYEKSGSSVTKTGQATIEANDLQVNSTSNFALPMNATTINAEAIVSGDVLTDTLESTDTTTATLAVTASGKAPKMNIDQLTATNGQITTLTSTEITSPAASITLMTGVATLANALTH